MSLLSILVSPDLRLKQISEFVDEPLPNDSMDELIDNMIETATAQDLVGLAAPQVGINQRIFIVDMNSRDLSKEILEDNNIEIDLPFKKNFKVFINPEISHYSTEKAYDWEGCASIPGLIGLVKRSLSIEVKYLDSDGKFYKEDFYGWIARIISHENDHLLGILFTKTARETRRINEKLVD